MLKLSRFINDKILKMEETPIRQSPEERIIERRQKEGWDHVGMDQTNETRFQKDSARFLEEKVRTEEQIRDTFRDKLKQQIQEAGQDYEVEIELEPYPVEEYQGIPLKDRAGRFLVFAKVKR
jgi:hypothetical protein